MHDYAAPVAGAVLEVGFKAMNRQKATEVLKRHNEWRRHDGDDPMELPDSPSDIGLAIDAVVGRCRWVQKDPDPNVFYTGCNNAHRFEDGGIDDNIFDFCPYCGGEIDG